jgi:hypothetical protein
MEDKKAVCLLSLTRRDKNLNIPASQNTIVISAQRASLDAARRRWLHRHRHLFQPLLPSASILFSNIAKELEVSTDMTPYTPLHELDEQPKLVQNGTMKDYQVSRDCPSSASAALTHHSATRSILPCMDVQQWCVDLGSTIPSAFASN